MPIPSNTPLSRRIARAAQSVVDSTLPIETVPTVEDFDTLMAVDSSQVADFPEEERTLIFAGLLTARLRMNQLDAIPAILRQLSTTPHRGTGRTGLIGSIALLTSLAEASVFLADAERARVHAARALEEAQRLSDPQWIIRALGLIALSEVVSGRASRGAKAIEQSHALLRTLDADSARDYATEIADFLVGFVSADPDRLERQLQRLRTPPPVHPAWNVLSNLAEVAHLFHTEREYEGLALVSRILSGVDFAVMFDSYLAFAKVLQACLLVRTGEPYRALTVLDGLSSTADHTFCLPLIRSAALMQLHAYDALLTETSDCFRRRREHTSWSYSAVMFRRGIAYLRLGDDLQARRAFEAALERIQDAELRPLMGFLLPASDVADAVRSLQSVVLDGLGDGFLADASRAPSAPPCFHTPSFTPREKEIAQQLRHRSDIRELADELSVSVSTIATHASAVYGKLGVSTRDEAVLMLEQRGWFDAPAGYR